MRTSVTCGTIPKGLTLVSEFQKEKICGTEKIFEEMMAENSPNLINDKLVNSRCCLMSRDTKQDKP